MSANPETPAKPEATAYRSKQPDGRPPETVEARLVLGFVTAFVILLAMTGMAVRNTLQSRASSDWVNQTHAVILELNAVGSTLQEMEARLQAYVLVGADQELAALQKADASVREHLAVCKSLMQTDPRQLAGIASIEPLVTNRLHWADSIVVQRRSAGLEQVKSSLLGAEANEARLALKKSISDQVTQENQRLLVRDQLSNTNARRTRWILYGGTLVNLLLLIGGYVLIRDDLKLRRLHASLLADANEALEKRVMERTAEITKANDALQVENIERRWAVSSLERHQRHNELIINSVSEGIWVVSKPGYILRSNLAGALHTGLSHEGMVGKRVHRLLLTEGGGAKPSDWQAHPVALAMKSARATQGLKMHLCKQDGSMVAALCNVQPMLDSGQVVGAIVCFQVQPQ